MKLLMSERVRRQDPKGARKWAKIKRLAEEVEKMGPTDAVAGRSELLSEGVRKQISFMRVWCLVEACQAAQIESMPYILKCGSYKKESDNSILFDSDPIMLMHLPFLVDIEKAEATVESDRLRIINEVRNTIGIEKLNSVIRGSVNAAFTASAFKDNVATIQCAACGDQEAMDLVMADPKSILHVAANGFVTLFKELLAGGKHSVEETESDLGITPIILASMGGHYHIVKLLIEASVDLNKRCIYTLYDATALMYASESGHAAVVDLLIKAGADVNATYDGNGTSLMLAAECGHESVVKILLKASADVSTQNSDGSTAIMLASENGHESVVDLLKSHGAILDDDCNDDDKGDDEDNEYSSSKEEEEEVWETQTEESVSDEDDETYDTKDDESEDILLSEDEDKDEKCHISNECRSNKTLQC